VIMNIAQLFGLPRRPTAKPPAAANAVQFHAIAVANLHARIAVLERDQARRELAVAQARARIRERCMTISGLPQHRQEAALAQAMAGDMAADLAVVARRGMSGVGARSKATNLGAA